MKIIYTIHDYWPEHMAGAENYTHYIAHAMARLGHDVYIFTVEKNYKDDYSVERYVEVGDRVSKLDSCLRRNDSVVKKSDGQKGKKHCYVEHCHNDKRGVNVIKVHKQNSHKKTLESTYEDENIYAIFKDIFDEVKPDIVHVQHLLNLSVNMIDYIKSKNMPVLYTLHDLWLECFNVNRLTTDRQKLCSGASIKKCMKCYKPARFNRNPSLLDKFYLKSSRITGLDGKKKHKEIQKRNNIMKKLINDVDLFISPSKYLRDEFLKWGIPGEKIVYSRNGMKIDDCGRLDSRLRGNDKCDDDKYDSSGKLDSCLCRNDKCIKKDIVFVFTSHLRKLKGIEVLLEACEILQNRSIENISIELYGRIDGDDSQKEKFIKEKIEPLKSAKYCGEFENKEINNILRDADYLILPSIWPENAPLVIDEAYINKVPCIVSNIGGMAERIDDGINGLHFKVGNAKDLANKMEYVAKNRHVRDRFIENIPKVKSIEKNAVELEKIYESMI